MYLLWNNYLRQTASVIPCEQCRHHMKDYLAMHSFLPKNWIQQKGIENANQIQKWVFVFHNAVNERLGKSLFLASSLPALPISNRQQIVDLLQATYASLLKLWSNQKSLLGEWRRTSTLLLQLVASGPN
jgi:hypothetical protein